jgi:hypothetical protein
MRIKNHYIKSYNIVISHENQYQKIGDFYKLKCLK